MWGNNENFLDNRNVGLILAIRQVCKIRNRLSTKSEIKFDIFGRKILSHIFSSFLNYKFSNVQRIYDVKFFFGYDFAYLMCIVRQINKNTFNFMSIMTWASHIIELCGPGLWQASVRGRKEIYMECVTQESNRNNYENNNNSKLAPICR